MMPDVTVIGVVRIPVQRNMEKIMSTILRFDPGRVRQAPRCSADDGSAAILFFTGVRYERHDEGPPPATERTISPPQAKKPTEVLRKGRLKKA